MYSLALVRADGVCIRDTTYWASKIVPEMFDTANVGAGTPALGTKSTMTLRTLEALVCLKTGKYMCFLYVA